jgi:hypothetical protein
MNAKWVVIATTVRRGKWVAYGPARSLDLHYFDTWREAFDYAFEQAGK